MMVAVVCGILSRLRQGAVVHHLLHFTQRDSVGGIVGVFGDDGAGAFAFHHLFVLDLEFAFADLPHGGHNTGVLINALSAAASGKDKR